MQTLINVGDEIQNSMGETVTITGVVNGRYGLLLEGRFASGGPYLDYLPYELPSCESYWHQGKGGWYGWADRAKITLSNGMELGAVCMREGLTADLELCDKEWEAP